MTITRDDKITKPHPGTEPKGEPIKAAAWKNVDVLKDGRSYVGVTTYDTEDAAKQKADSEERAIRTFLAKGDNRRMYLGQYEIVCYFSEFSHTFQTPWKG